MRWVSVLQSVLQILTALGLMNGLWDAWQERARSSKLRTKSDKNKSPIASAFLKRLSRLLTSSSEEQENIIGDLLEEFYEFPSRLRAHLWLYKQVLKSVLPLVYKTAKSRLASYFGERVR